MLFAISAVATTVNVGPTAIDIHGFLTAGYAKSNARSDVATDLGITKQGSFNDISVAGLQFTMPLGEKFSATTQIIADGNDVEKFDVRAAWAYLKYKPINDLSVKAGRIRNPLFMLSQYLNVGYAYNFVEPPQEVYQVVPVPNLTGVTADYKHTFSNGWYVETQPIFASTKEDVYISGASVESTFHDFVGASLAVGNKWLLLRGVAVTTKTSAESPASVVVSPTLTVTFPSLSNVRSNFWGVGLQIEKDHFHFLSEYGARNLRNTIYGGLYGWYANVGYQLGKFMPNITYAIHRSTHESDVAKFFSYSDDPAVAAVQRAVLEAGTFEDQNSWTAGLRYNMSSHVALKADLQFIHLLHGTKGLFASMPNRDTIGVGYLAVNVVF